MKEKRFIKSQKISGSSKEVFIVKYAGMLIEIERNVNIYEPLKVRLDGELIETIPSKQNKEIEIKSVDGVHKLHVWNERADNRFFLPIFAKDGVGIVIDGIPVQNSLADPVLKMKSTIITIWVLVALLFFKSFLAPLANIKEITEPEQFTFIFIYITFFILSLVAAVTFKSNPLRSVWLALLVTIIEIVDHSIYYFTIETSFIALIHLGVRVLIFSQLVISLRNIKLILSFNDDYVDDRKIIESKSNHTQNPNRKRIFSTRKIILFVIPLIIVGGYFILNEIKYFEKQPQIFRSSSTPLINNLKLPSIIPNIKNKKIHFTNRTGEFVCGDFDNVKESPDNEYWSVSKNELWGIIDSNGKEVIPISYNEIKFQEDSKYLLASNENGKWGVVDLSNSIIISFNYATIKKHPTRDLFVISRFDKKQYGVIDINGKLVVPEDYTNLEFYNDYIIAEKAIKNKESSGLLTLDGLVEIAFADDATFPSQAKFGLSSDLIVYELKNSIDPLLSDYFILDLKNKIIKNNDYYSGLYNPYLRPKENGFSFILAEDKNSRIGVLNTEGEIIIPFQYDDVDYSYSNLGLDSLSSSHRFIKVSNENKWGVVNAYNQIVLPIVFDEIKIFTKGEENLFAAKNKNLEKMGVVNKDEEVVIPFEYDDIYSVDFNNRLIIAEKNNRTGAIDFNNQIIFPFIYSPHGIYPSEGSIFLIKTVDEDSLNTLMQSKTFHKYNRLEEIHNGLMNGSRSYQGLEIIKNPNYFYSDYTTLELQIILSEPDKRKEFYDTNKMYFKEIYTFEEFTLLLLGDGNYDFPGKWGIINKNGEILMIVFMMI